MTPREEAWLALSLVHRLGAKSLGELLAAFGDPEALLAAPPERLSRASGVGKALADRIHGAQETQAFRMERDLVGRHGVRLMPWDAPAYPQRLLDIALPPPLLYGLGEVEALNTGLPLAVVGTRSASRYGEKAVAALVEGLAALRPDTVIVSGLARGIDTFAHRHALNCGLKTVAVMACGLQRVYPPENEALAAEIGGRGALLSEFAMTQRPRANHFPIRNRIISGVAAGVVVVEAAERSGALITAGFAQNHGRPVFAVPGNIDQAGHRGTNRLIQTGQARLVREAGDILQGLQAAAQAPAPRQLDWLAPEAPEPPAGPAARYEGDKGRVLESLADGPLHPDDLADESRIPIEKLVGLLLELELSGDIRQTTDNRYSLA